MAIHVLAWLWIEPYRFVLAFVLRGERLLPFVRLFEVNQMESLPDLVAKIWLACAPLVGAFAWCAALVGRRLVREGKNEP